MLKKYRRRFVVSNMSLIGAVMLIILTVIGIYMANNYYSELENTMSQVLGPLNSPTENFRPISPVDVETDADSPKYPEDFGNQAQNDPRGYNGDILRDQNITTVFYSLTDGTISIHTNNSSLDSDTITNAVYEIVDGEKTFGTLSGYNLIYYKISLGDTCKIALADTYYIGSRILSTVLVLLLIFTGSMLLFYPISRWLSKLAAKPMEDAIDMERQFVADISHDLKTPITVILANNSILRDNPEAKTSEQSQWIDNTDAAARNMLGMISQMLTLSSLESVNQTVQKVKVNLSSIAEKSALQMESVAFDRGVTMDTDIDEGVFVSANTEYVERICTSLIENALKYEPDAGSVRISLKPSKHKAVLEVQNFGSIISPEDLPHVFERFYRGDKTRDIQKGHGLGLSITKRMAELLGAQISVKSDEENGTVFAVVFDTVEG